MTALPLPKGSLVELFVPVFVALVVGEAALLAIRRREGAYEGRDTLTSLLMGLGSTASGLLLKGIGFGLLMLVYRFRLWTIAATPLAFVACFVLDDLRYYWSHRLSHRVRWFWANHVVHHSSQHYNLSTALRQPWAGELTGLALLQAPLALIGFHPLVIVFSASANLIYQFWVHTEAIDRLPRWVEAVFNTPSHHRAHHARNPRYLDANYAGTLIVWDRMFGSFVPEDRADAPRYGLVHNIGTFNPVSVATHEYRSIWRDATARGLTFRQRLAYVFAEPGWSHDGSRLTSADLKARAEKRPSASSAAQSSGASPSRTEA